MNPTCLNFTDRIRDAVSRIRFAPMSNNLLISSWDSNLRLYDMDKCELKLEAPTEGAVLDCCFESESTALSAGSDGSILRYDINLQTKTTVGKHDDLATCVEYSAETRRIVSAGLDKKVRFWDTRMSGPATCLSSLGLEVESMALSGFSCIVASRSSIYTYDLRNLNDPVQSKEPFLNIHMKCVRSIFKEGFAAGSIDGHVALEYLCQADSNNKGYAFRCHPKDKNGRQHIVAVNDIAFSPAVNGVFVTGDNEGYVAVWDAMSKKRLLEFPKYPNSVASLAYNYDGQLLAIASSFTYQEGIEREETPQIFVHQMDDSQIRSCRRNRGRC